MTPAAMGADAEVPVREKLHVTHLKDQRDDPGRHGGGCGGAGVGRGAEVVQVGRHHLPLTRRARARENTAIR